MFDFSGGHVVSSITQYMFLTFEKRTKVEATPSRGTRCDGGGRGRFGKGHTEKIAVQSDVLRLLYGG